MAPPLFSCGRVARRWRRRWSADCTLSVVVAMLNLLLRRPGTAALALANAYLFLCRRCPMWRHWLRQLSTEWVCVTPIDPAPTTSFGFGPAPRFTSGEHADQVRWRLCGAMYCDGAVLRVCVCVWSTVMWWITCCVYGQCDVMCARLPRWCVRACVRARVSAGARGAQGRRPSMEDRAVAVDSMVVGGGVGSVALWCGIAVLRTAYCLLPIAYCLSGSVQVRVRRARRRLRVRVRCRTVADGAL